VISDEDLQNFFDEKIANKDFDWTIYVKNLGALSEDRKALSEIFDVR
jgi:hypothetical protein